MYKTIIYKSNYLLVFANYYYEVNKCTHDIEVRGCQRIYYRADIRKGKNDIFSSGPAHNAIAIEAHVGVGFNSAYL
jgi:hypothetical protein